jgi:hypothetical protein
MRLLVGVEAHYISDSKQSRRGCAGSWRGFRLTRDYYWPATSSVA